MKQAAEARGAGPAPQHVLERQPQARPEDGGARVLALLHDTADSQLLRLGAAQEKELKQTCQIRNFIGYNENAVKWQVWTGLLVHMLLR